MYQRGLRGKKDVFARDESLRGDHYKCLLSKLGEKSGHHAFQAEKEETSSMFDSIFASSSLNCQLCPGGYRRSKYHLVLGYDPKLSRAWPAPNEAAC